MEQEPSLWTLIRAIRGKALAEGALAALPVPEREAHLFAAVLDGLPIGLEAGETLAGDFGWRFADAVTRAALRAQIASLPQATPGEPEPLQLLAERFHCSAGYTLAHTCADYERVITRGLDGILAEIHQAQEDAGGERLETLRGMAVALEAVCRWAERYAAQARRQAAQQTEEAARRELLELAARCERVPRLPAWTFAEAVQSVWFVHAAIGLSEQSDASLSLGRADQYLYPLFQQERERGVPGDFQVRVLRDLWRKLNRFGDPACAVNLGGADAAGNDQFNPLSALMVETSKALRLPSPLLTARLHARTPAAVFDALTDPALLAMGQPTFYGEEACRAALLRRGMPAAETYRFAVNSCMGLVIPGAEISDMWGAVVNLLLPLELTLNGGKPFAGALPVTLKTPPQAAYDSFEALYAQFCRYLDEIISLLVAANREATEHAGREQPNPYLSALTADCIQRGQDRALGGARYHSVIVEGFGWCSVADAFTAIRQLVFETGHYTLTALTTAARNDYQGDEALRRALLRCPKYGNSDPKADAMARRVLETFAAQTRRHERENVRYLPSCHTLNAHLAAGKKIPASLDGRRAGDALGKNLGPLVGRNTQGLTALLLSASALDQTALSGGQALDISLEPSLIRTVEGRRKLQAALLAYFKRGGLQIQVNGASAAELRAAMADPEAHRDLLVRIAGYSARFVTLSREIQEEMIQRFAHGL